MKRTFLFFAVSVGAAFVAAACGGAGTTGYNGAPNAAGGTPAGSGGTSVAVENSSLGQILVDGSGRTLYLFEADMTASSSCYNACVGVWPAAVTAGSPVAGQGVNASLLGTTKRKDGALELVYNGHPLYYFTGDKKSGDVTGQGLNSFGAAWYLVSPSGAKVGTAASQGGGGY